MHHALYLQERPPDQLKRFEALVDGHGLRLGRREQACTACVHVRGLDRWRHSGESEGRG